MNASERIEALAIKWILILHLFYVPRSEATSEAGRTTIIDSDNAPKVLLNFCHPKAAAGDRQQTP